MSVALKKSEGALLVEKVANEGSAKYVNRGATQTIRTTNLDMHWLRLGLRDRWDALRITRFCAWRDCTVYDVASAVHMDHSRMNRLMKGAVPTGPEAIVLTLHAIGEMGFPLASEFLGGLPAILMPVEDGQP